MNLESVWRDAFDSLPDSVPAWVRPWILLGSSMTQALHTAVSADIQVNVLRDEAGCLLPDELDLLGSPPSMVHVREVILHDDHEALLAARTVYAIGNSEAHRELAALGSNPLGQLLFAKGEPQYLRRQFIALDARTPLFMFVRRVAGDVRQACWARRSLFLFEHQRLLVTEIFLPAMCRHLSVLPDAFS